ncbi:MAG: alkaline phosphatase family protein [Propionibacteriaceae bacterium]|jgi:hypothetical protein|nr:alkaline phosphatase family protein [Propionibacteriaceae bacterium]
MRTPKDSDNLVIPEYGRASLVEMLPSIGAHLGLKGAQDFLGLPQTGKYIVLLIDGLGWFQFQKCLDYCPFLAQLGEVATGITAPLPSTTATSMTSLGTGLPPGSHGVAGYSFRYNGELLNALHFPKDVRGLDLQPQLTYVERLVSSGVSFFVVSQRRFEKSGLTEVALRGTKFLSTGDSPLVDTQAELALDAAGMPESAVVFVYESRVDKAGHAYGVGSDEWLRSLSAADVLGQMLFEGLDENTSLVITADHGMVNIPSENRVTAQDYPDALDGVSLLGGEGRFRHIYTEIGADSSVVQAWGEILGDRAEVVLKEQAIAEGWFGSVSPQVADRFGDVLVACRRDYAFMTKEQPNEYKLVGMHGSRTAAELLVPLITGTNN